MIQNCHFVEHTKREHPPKRTNYFSKFSPLIDEDVDFRKIAVSLAHIFEQIV